MKKGRPSKYTRALAGRICAELAKGRTLRKICDEEGFPSFQTVINWTHSNKTFFEQYARAREVQAHFWQDECVDISDDGSADTYQDNNGNTRTDWEVVGRSKLRIDTRKWILERMTSKAPEALQNQPVVLNFVSDPKPERYAKPEADKNGTKDK